MPEPEQPGAGAPTTEGADAPRFTQADVERLAAKEKSQGKRAGMRELAEEAGFDDVEAFKAWVTESKQREQEALSDQQRKEQEIAQREAAAAQREREAAKRLAEANRRAALVTLGATGDDLDDALALLGARVGDDVDEDTLASEAESLKERRPELFGGATGGEERRPVPDSRLRGAPRNPKPPTVKPGARGLSEAQRRFGDRAGVTTDA